MSGIINGGGDNDSLLNDVKKYIDLNIDYLKVAGTEKLAIILSSIAVVAAVMILGGIALFYISFSGVYLIESWVGSESLAYLVVGLIMLILLAIVYAFRMKLIVNPIARFVSKLFLDKSK